MTIWLNAIVSPVTLDGVQCAPASRPAMGNAQIRYTSVVRVSEAPYSNALRHAPRIVCTRNISHGGASRVNDTSTTPPRAHRYRRAPSPPNVVTVGARLARRLRQSPGPRPSVPAPQRVGLRANPCDRAGTCPWTAARFVDRLRSDEWPRGYRVAQAARDCDSSRGAAASGQLASRQLRRARGGQVIRFDYHAVPPQDVRLRAAASDGRELVLSSGPESRRTRFGLSVSALGGRGGARQGHRGSSRHGSPPFDFHQ